ncbi:hypothetical protein [Desulfoluna butyratoxydans]|uniref:Uncharacterized protein n=1 Tax=Desulfoluna butyratoxydans TaxID=231438 RepID=A0A4V6ILX4_9BACT|nr:hypothetical protein [Desulfoluna butyratoxydans]VFQ46798.1 hypothetical protein MSL71_44740 [Desulfoluna butyratoxydans]
MMKTGNPCLAVAGCCSVAIAALHTGIVIGGRDWYHFFGAGESMVAMAENGSWVPMGITTAIILVFLVFGLYAFSGAGYVRRLPFTRAALVMISCVYLTRGIGSIPVIVFVEHPYLEEMNTRIVFVFVSSVLSLVIGVLHGIGTLALWTMGPEKNGP